MRMEIYFLKDLIFGIRHFLLANDALTTIDAMYELFVHNRRSETLQTLQSD